MDTDMDMHGLKTTVVAEWKRKHNMRSMHVCGSIAMQGMEMNCQE